MGSSHYLASHWELIEFVNTLIVEEYTVTGGLPLIFAGAQVLYRLQPDLRDKAVGYVTDLSEHLTGKTLEVHTCQCTSGMTSRFHPVWGGGKKKLIAAII